jgi:ribosomal protein L21E
MICVVVRRDDFLEKPRTAELAREVVQRRRGRVARCASQPVVVGHAEALPVNVHAADVDRQTEGVKARSPRASRSISVRTHVAHFRNAESVELRTEPAENDGEPAIANEGRRAVGLVRHAAESPDHGNGRPHSRFRRDQVKPGARLGELAHACVTVGHSQARKAAARPSRRPRRR